MREKTFKGLNALLGPSSQETKYYPYYFRLKKQCNNFYLTLRKMHCGTSTEMIQSQY